MQCGMVGLGRMGANMARRLLRGGHEVVVTNRSPEPIEQLTAEGASGERAVGELVERLQAPRAIWVSLPAGDVTETTLSPLAPLLTRGDVIVKSGNSFYRDTIRRAESLAQNGIELLDQGTSGGIWGLGIGYFLMIGGSREAFGRVEPAFKTLAPPDGYLHTGPSGSGHTSSRWCTTALSTACSRPTGRASRFSTRRTSRHSICVRSRTCGIRAASCAPGSSSWPNAASRRSRISHRFAAMSRTRARAVGRGGGPRQGRARTRPGALAPDAIPVATGGQLRRESDCGVA
jgi:hypothetical protein